jgi:hypothetical protein
MARYTAVQVFHYPDGVALPGESITATGELARRGVESGALVPAADPPRPKPSESQEPS